MHPIIYDVSVSLDGFISGPGGNVSLFDHQGAVVDDYYARLAGYRTAFMGRGTYEFGYAFGMKPGANPYPHMETHVFSNTLELPDGAEVQVRLASAEIKDVRATAQGPVYLCGGGVFAASLLNAGLIDIIRLKRAPIVLGGGVPLFAGDVVPGRFRCTDHKAYESGYVYQEFTLAH